MFKIKENPTKWWGFQFRYRLFGKPKGFSIPKDAIHPCTERDVHHDQRSVRFDILELDDGRLAVGIHHQAYLAITGEDGRARITLL